MLAGYDRPLSSEPIQVAGPKTDKPTEHEAYLQWLSGRMAAMLLELSVNDLVHDVPKKHSRIPVYDDFLRDGSGVSHHFWTFWERNWFPWSLSPLQSRMAQTFASHILINSAPGAICNEICPKLHIMAYPTRPQKAMKIHEQERRNPRKSLLSLRKKS